MEQSAISRTGCIAAHHLPTRTENISLSLEFSGPLVTNSLFPPICYIPVPYWLCKLPLQHSAWQCQLNKYIFNNNNNNQIKRPSQYLTKVALTQMPNMMNNREITCRLSGCRKTVTSPMTINTAAMNTMAMPAAVAAAVWWTEWTASSVPLVLQRNITHNVLWGLTLLAGRRWLLSGGIPLLSSHSLVHSLWAGVQPTMDPSADTFISVQCASTEREGELVGVCSVCAHCVGWRKEQ